MAASAPVSSPRPCFYTFVYSIAHHRVAVGVRCLGLHVMLAEGLFWTAFDGSDDLFYGKTVWPFSSILTNSSSVPCTFYLNYRLLHLVDKLLRPRHDTENLTTAGRTAGTRVALARPAWVAHTTLHLECSSTNCTCHGSWQGRQALEASGMAGRPFLLHPRCRL